MNAKRTGEAISKEVRAEDYPPFAPKILQRQFDDVAGNRGPRLQKLGLEPVVEGDVLRALHIAHRLHLQIHGLRLQRSLLQLVPARSSSRACASPCSTAASSVSLILATQCPRLRPLPPPHLSTLYPKHRKRGPFTSRLGVRNDLSVAEWTQKLAGANDAIAATLPILPNL